MLIYWKSSDCQANQEFVASFCGFERTNCFSCLSFEIEREICIQLHSMLWEQMCCAFIIIVHGWVNATHQDIEPVSFPFMLILLELLSSFLHRLQIISHLMKT